MSFEPLNINSSYEVSSQAHQLAMDSCGFLYRRWRDVPVYLVDPYLMDIISPPQERRFLNPDCVKEILTSLQYEPGHIDSEDEPEHIVDTISRENERFWGRLEQCSSPGVMVPARAVYIPRVNSSQRRAINDHLKVRIPFRNQFGDQPFGAPISLDNIPGFGELIHCGNRIDSIQLVLHKHEEIPQEGEAIFICMERLVEASQKVREQYGFKTTTTLPGVLESIYVCTLIHELVHAYNHIDFGRYGPPWGKVMEESLAQAWAMRCFVDTPHFPTLQVDTAVNLMLEYQGYSFFNCFSQKELHDLIDAWRVNDCKKALSLFLPRELKEETVLIHPDPNEGLQWKEQIPSKMKAIINGLTYRRDVCWMALAREVLCHAVDA